METVRNLFLISLLTLLVSSCASIVPVGGLDAKNCNPNLNLACVEKPEVVEMPTHEQLRNLPKPEKPVIVAVYQYMDKTGQRKQKGNPGLGRPKIRKYHQREVSLHKQYLLCLEGAYKALPHSTRIKRQLLDQPSPLPQLKHHNQDPNKQCQRL